MRKNNVSDYAKAGHVNIYKRFLKMNQTVLHWCKSYEEGLNMLFVIILLLIAGTALMIAEGIAPGFSVFGAAGIISMAVACVITAVFMPYGYVLVLAEIVGVGVVVVVFLRYIKNSQLYGRLILNETLKTEKVTDYSNLLGREGIAVTSLRPVGNVNFSGNVLEVHSNGQYIPEKSYVKVVEVREGKIIVSQTQARHEEEPQSN